MIKEMFKKDPINNPQNGNDSIMANQHQYSQILVRVNCSMDSSQLKSHIVQALVDTTSDITCNRKKHDIDSEKNNLLKQSMSINQGKKSFKINNIHLFEGKAGYYK